MKSQPFPELSDSFEAGSAEEAVELARKALGADAQVRCWKTRRGGVLGFFAREMYVAGVVEPAGAKEAKPVESAPALGEPTATSLKAEVPASLTPDDTAALSSDSTTRVRRAKVKSGDRSIEHVSGGSADSTLVALNDLIESTHDEVSFDFVDRDDFVAGEIDVATDDAFRDVLAEAEAALSEVESYDDDAVMPALALIDVDGDVDGNAETHDDDRTTGESTEDLSEEEQDDEVLLSTASLESAESAEIEQSQDAAVVLDVVDFVVATEDVQHDVTAPTDLFATDFVEIAIPEVNEVFEEYRDAVVDEGEDFRENLAMLGVPERFQPLLAEDPLEGLARSLRLLPRVPALPNAAGSVIAVVGRKSDATEVAHDVARRLNLTPADVMIASDEPTFRRRMTRRKSSGSVTVVVVGVGRHASDLSASADTLKRCQPDAVIGAVPVSFLNSDAGRWRDELGVEVLALARWADAERPARLMGELPIMSIDGVTMSVVRWFSLLLSTHLEQ